MVNLFSITYLFTTSLSDVIPNIEQKCPMKTSLAILIFFLLLFLTLTLNNAMNKKREKTKMEDKENILNLLRKKSTKFQPFSCNIVLILFFYMSKIDGEILRGCFPTSFWDFGPQRSKFGPNWPKWPNAY